MTVFFRYESLYIILMIITWYFLFFETRLCSVVQTSLELCLNSEVYSNLIFPTVQRLNFNEYGGVLLFKIYLNIILYVWCVCGHLHPMHSWASQRTISSRLSPTWVLGITFMSQGLRCKHFYPLSYLIFFLQCINWTETFYKAASQMLNHWATWRLPPPNTWLYSRSTDVRNWNSSRTLSLHSGCSLWLVSYMFSSKIK